MKSKSKHLCLRGYLWKRRFGYKPEPKSIDLRWTTVITHGVITVPIKTLLPSMCTENGNVRVPIENTPHYQWIKDLVDGNDDAVSKENYRRYVEAFCSHDTYFPWSAEEKLNNVIKMVASYQSDPEKREAITIITAAPKRKFRVCPYAVKIYDGVHRAAIAMALGNKCIRCLVK